MAARATVDFEPYCTWQRDQERDTLMIHLQGFKKDQLRIQLSNLGVMAITGERPIEDNKTSRFRKEVKITKDYKTNEIHAKMSGGILYITMPKVTPPSPPPSQDQPTATPPPPTPPPPPPQNQESKTNVPDSISNKENTTAELGSGENAALLTAKQSSFGIGFQKLLSKNRQIMNKSRNIGVAVALMVVIGAIVAYKYRQPS
ncbi:uncharacterized protein LOC126687166 [Mercurialis annua]|uniref:uncharacterized protein LOC126687166 n=1 Tax=Mercurialis annua TaxID=3986 RepID=UPI00215FF1B4|nr:uncharacterized protein LOC126687166 [Mercurialis annua]